jgi:DNA-binding NarL/FixJ family response regulator
MIDAVLVADSGSVMASVTAALRVTGCVEIVAYASGRADVGDVVGSRAPDVVLVDEMLSPRMALRRIAEIRSVRPEAVIVGLSADAEATWVIAGLRAGAAAVVPRNLEPAMLALVISEAFAAAAQPAPVEAIAS